MKIAGFALLDLAMVAASSASVAERIVNGSFEMATSQTATPTGQTSIGHSDGAIAYSSFGTPAYRGSYHYAWPASAGWA